MYFVLLFSCCTFDQVVLNVILNKVDIDIYLQLFFFQLNLTVYLSCNYKYINHLKQ